MFKITFDFNADQAKKAIMTKAAKIITEKVRRIRCPEHGKYAQIVAQGNSPDKINFQVSGCCEKLIETVRSKLKS